MAISAHENLNLIAVGFKDGTVLLLRGNITRDRQSRQSVIHREVVSNCYVTGQEDGNKWTVDTTNALEGMIKGSLHNTFTYRNDPACWSYPVHLN